MTRSLLLACAAIVAFGGPARAAEAARPNVLFCIADDASPHFGAYGCTWVKTPAIDRRAAAGLAFDNAYTPTARCAPSRAALLTGRYPWQLEEVKRLGERGLTITRFKGLGEMDPEELWETTLDPARRTLLRVNLDDALKADEMFRTLMGEKVEPRREFIQKHALEVKDIDYHGA